MSGDHNMYQKAPIKGEGASVYTEEEIANAPPPTIEDGGPAYPTNNWEKMVPLSTGYHEGMTLRDYFAAKAVQAWMTGWATDRPSLLRADVMADKAYEAANAMLKARQL